jgi:hypothetical protein
MLVVKRNTAGPQEKKSNITLDRLFSLEAGCPAYSS